MRRARTIWSPVEEEYLRENLDKKSRDQLCIALGKSRSALDKKIKEIKNVSTNSDNPDAPVIALGQQSRVGKRKDLDIYFRSSWEANFYRYSKSRHSPYAKVKYEPELFSFTDYVPPKGQALSYLPDFHLVDKTTKESHWVEVKGNWLRSYDKTKLRRFKRFYPEEFKKLLAVVSSKKTKTAKFFLDLGVPEENLIEYNELNKKFKKVIPNWE